MKNLIGKWIVSETLQFDEEKGMVWVKKADLLAQEDLDSDIALMLDTEFVFNEDETLVMLSPLPEDITQEEIDEAVAAGEIELKDGKMITGQNHWKFEDGKYLSDTGMEGEVLDEKVGPWEEIKEIDENTIEITMFRLTKAE